MSFRDAPAEILPLAKRVGAQTPSARKAIRVEQVRGSVWERDAGGLADPDADMLANDHRNIFSLSLMLPHIVAGLKDHRCGIRIEGHANWIAPSLDSMNLVLQHVTDHDDAAVALCEMLL